MKTKSCKSCDKTIKPPHIGRECKMCQLKKQRAKAQKAKERVKERAKVKRTKQQNSPTRLKKALDIVFSQWVRQSNADRNGYVKCVTCGVVKHYKEMQAGHYISRSHMNTRWDEKNVHPQCFADNIYKKGDYPNYTLYLIKKYGAGVIDELIEKQRTIKKFTAQDLHALINHYKSLIKEL